MARAWGVLSSIFVAFLSAGCSGAPTAYAPPVVLDSNQGRRTICVLSAVGSQFWVQTIGMTVFGNEQASAPIPSWGIDDSVTSKLAALIGSRADVKRIAAPTGTFAGRGPQGGLFGDTSTDIVDGLRKTTANRGCDSILVATAAGSRFGDTNQSIGALGIVRSGNDLLGRHYWLHTLFHLRVYDGRTFQYLGWKPATLGESTFMATIRGPSRKVDADWWPQTVNVEGDARLKAATLDLIGQALTATLPEALTLSATQVAKR